MHGSLKHLLNLSPLLHLYSLSQSQDFSPGFPQIPPASLVSSFISLLVILWHHFPSSNTPLYLVVSCSVFTTYFKFLSDPFYDALSCSIASLTKYNIPSRKYIMISLFSISALWTVERFLIFPDSTDTTFVECTHARIKFCLACHIHLKVRS